MGKHHEKLFGIDFLDNSDLESKKMDKTLKDGKLVYSYQFIKSLISESIFSVPVRKS
ncbi:MAG: hypothetical protein MRJ93_03285 [Nitrososphaeraceae archaeon]|nr:hypothetical protein [Nitrososphaeraceae archaeon]